MYGIIKAHGAYLDLQSEEGRGTTITLYIEANMEETEEVAQQSLEKISQGNNELILLIDDDEMVVDANKNILLQLGYSIESYTKPVEALRHFRADPAKFHLIISDLSMPEMDGVRLISNVRQLRPSIPAILCTGYIDAMIQTEAESLSNFTVLNKPCSLSEISIATYNAPSFTDRSHAELRN